VELLIFHIPHASTHLPQECLEGFALSMAELDAELLAMTDHFTDELFIEHATAEDTLVVSPVSRLVVDMERFVDDAKEPMAEIGMGVIYTSTSRLKTLRKAPGPRERAELIQRYYVPHHNALENAADSELEKNGGALIVDCHSFPSSPLDYELDRSRDRPDFCIGVDRFHSPPGSVAALQRFLQDQGYSVKINSPFCGSIVPMKHYGMDSRVASIMIEINRSLYMDECTGEKIAGFSALKGDLEAAIELIRNMG
jgi:N-formylglutamate deformylase